MREWKGEIRTKEYTPFVEKWALYFERSGGMESKRDDEEKRAKKAHQMLQDLENRIDVMIPFVKFWDKSPCEDKFVPPGRCVLGGIPERGGIVNRMHTGLIQEIQYVITLDVPEKDAPCVIMRAVDKSGEEYYFDLNDPAGRMLMMKYDLEKKGELSSYIFHYLEFPWKDTNYI